MNQVLVQRITKSLKNANKKGLSFKELLTLCGVRPNQQREFRECIRFLEKQGTVLDRKFKIYHTDFLNLSRGTVSRIMKTFGFVKLDDDSEMFIPGKFFMGAMPGDTVLVAPIKGRGASPEGEIVKVLAQSSSEFTGILRENEEGVYIEPDSFIRFNIELTKGNIKDAKIGDKVRCRITERGERHAEHRAEIVLTYGDSQTAVNCAQAILDLNGITVDFTGEVSSSAEIINKKGISQSEISHRLDLRDDDIFTIDSADTKDIDDAISLTRAGDYYRLGVHIADVSYYVKPGSTLDEEALNRGTSIYFADRVVPMLPKALSNGICSLNEKVDRLTFSCIMAIDKEGKLVDFEFKKSVIHSKVKGVYSEINQILKNSETQDIKEKYAGLYDTIFLMKELAEILTRNKRERGAPEIETSESYIILDDNGIAVDIKPRTRGESEVLIEEFMLMANEAAASAAKLKEVPFVYRVHEPPSPEKIEVLHTALTTLGIPCSDVKEGLTAKVLSGLIEDAKGSKLYPIINTLVLRSMSKAKYHEVPIGHYGLALENYAQFTSPIRRYPDLAIHRVLGELASGMPSVKVAKKFEKYVVNASRRSTEAELNAMRLERECDDCYKAEYMKAHVGEEYDAIVSSLAHHGIYVMLDNTIEGLVKTDSLPSGEYEFDGMFEFKSLLNNKIYRIGDAVKVKCVSVDVSAGNIDFQVVE